PVCLPCNIAARARQGSVEGAPTQPRRRQRPATACRACFSYILAVIYLYVKMSIIDRAEPRRPGTRLHSGRQGVTGRICNHSNASKAEEGIAADESAGPGRWDRRNHDGLLPSQGWLRGDRG